MAKGIRERKPRARPVAQPRRRPKQERGEKRVEELLDAAAEVIAEVGVEATTTNAIADRADASVGSLYHFFPNKDAIIRALAARYDLEMRRINEASMPVEAARLPIPVMVEGIVTPLAVFMQQNPAYVAIFQATSDPRKPSCMTDDLHQTIVGLVDQLIAARNPGIPPDVRRFRAAFSVELVHRMLEYAWTRPAGERPAVIQELKRALALYTETMQSGCDPLRP